MTGSHVPALLDVALLGSGSLFLILLSSPLDWILVSTIAVVRAGFSITTILKAAIVGLLPVAFILLKPHQYLALLFDGTDAAPTETGQPVLIKCKTTHRRAFPEKHAFAYSYLVTGIPVGWKGQTGGILAADIPKGDELQRGPAWFEVKSEDHLHRGGADVGLRGKLDAYLSSENIDPAKYPHAYLITAPRFLGYVFNPVSFWYLYGNTKSLDAVICEVNNTFDERRMYFVCRDEPQKQLGHAGIGPGSSDGPGRQAHGSIGVSRIDQSIPKDFHVSPFNSRKGSYSIKATDPLGPGLQASRPFDTTITLCSSGKQPKIVARLFSLGSPLEPAQMTPLEKLKLALGWGWVGLLTFPRIVKEAGVLWFTRGLHVWLRPEPLASSIGRRATSAEEALEAVFRAYLGHLTEQSSKALAVKYYPSGIDGPAEVMRSPRTKEDEAREELEFRVLTPVFYTRFVHYAHDFEAIFAEFRENSTISVSNPDLLRHLLLKKPPPAVKTESFIDYLYFRSIRWLRRRPPRIVRPLRSCDPPAQPDTGSAVVDIRELRLSSMDGYVLSEASARDRRRYRSVVARILLANRMALGSLEAIWLLEVVLRASAAWVLLVAMQPTLDLILSDEGQKVD